MLMVADPGIRGLLQVILTVSCSLSRLTSASWRLLSPQVTEHFWISRFAALQSTSVTLSFTLAVMLTSPEMKDSYRLIYHNIAIGHQIGTLRFYFVLILTHFTLLGTFKSVLDKVWLELNDIMAWNHTAWKS